MVLLPGLLEHRHLGVINAAGVLRRYFENSLLMAQRQQWGAKNVSRADSSNVNTLGIWKDVGNVRTGRLLVQREV